MNFDALKNLAQGEGAAGKGAFDDLVKGNLGSFGTEMTAMMGSMGSAPSDGKVFSDLSQAAKSASIQAAVDLAAESSGAVAARFLASRGANFDEQILAASNAAAIAVLNNAGSLVDAGCLAAVAIRDVTGASVNSTKQAEIASQFVIEHGGSAEEAAETAARVVRDDFYFSMRSFTCSSTLSFRDWVEVTGKAAQAAGSAVLASEANEAKKNAKPVAGPPGDLVAARAEIEELKEQLKGGKKAADPIVDPAVAPVADKHFKLSEKAVLCVSTALSTTVESLYLWTNPLSDAPQVRCGTQASVN
jgi:hypothetical protein